MSEEKAFGEHGLSRLWERIKAYVADHMTDGLTAEEEQILLDAIGQPEGAFSDLTEEEEQILLARLEEIN